MTHGTQRSAVHELGTTYLKQPAPELDDQQHLVRLRLIEILLLFFLILCWSVGTDIDSAIAPPQPFAPSSRLYPVTLYSAATAIVSRFSVQTNWSFDATSPGPHPV